MSQPETTQGILRNVRVIDQDAVDSLVTKLEATLGRVATSATTLQGLVDKSDRAIAEAPDVVARLEEQFRTCSDLVQSLGTVVEQGHALSSELDGRQQRIDQVSAKLTEDLAERQSSLNAQADEIAARVNENFAQLDANFDQRQASIENLVDDIQRSADRMATDASDRFEERVSATLARAESLIEIVESAETNIAVLALRTAMGKRSSGDTTGETVTVAQSITPVPDTAATSQLAQECERLRSQINEMTARCSSIEQQNSTASTHQMETTNLVQSLKANLDSVSGQVQAHQRAIAELPRMISGDQDDQMAELRQKITAMTSKCDTMERDRAEAESRHAHLAGLFEGLKSAVDSITKIAPPPAREESAESSASNEEVKSLRKKVTELSARCELLERERSGSGEQRALLAGVCDELRAGLSELVQSSEVLRSTELSDQQREQIESATESVAALQDIVRSITDLSDDSIPESDPEGSGDDFDFRATMSGVLSLMTRRGEERGVVIDGNVADDVPAMVLGDRGRLRQILIYLIHGAMKLLTEGKLSVNVTVDLKEGEFVTMHVSVNHQGKGIARAKLDRLFIASDEQDADSASDDTPTSYGLAIAKQLAEQMGGRIGAQSEEEQGFALWFTATFQKRVARGDTRRTSNRLQVECVKSNLGPVLDLSLGGAKVMCTRELEGTVEIQIRDAESILNLQAEVTRVNQLGWRRYETGLRFLHISPDAAEALTNISMQNRVRRVMEDSNG